MIKKFSLCLVVLLILCISRSVYIVKEVEGWKPYASRQRDYDSLVYAYRDKDYNDLYEMVVVNEALNNELKDELYDFAHYYHELTIAHKNYLLNKDYSTNLKNMEVYLKAIKTKDLLESIEELNEIYKIEG